MAEEGLDEKEMLKIAQHFLLSSPPGQFNEVLGDVRKILPEGFLSESMAQGIARVYNNRNGKVLPTSNGNILINASTEIDPTHHFSSTLGSSVGVDHLSASSTDDSTPIPVQLSGESGGISLYREALQESLNRYVKAQYKSAAQLCSPGSACSVVCNESNVILININGELTNISNFKSGRFSSSWTVNPASSSISGEIKVHAHIFEDGNVQLQQSKAYPLITLRGSSESELASSVVAFIQSSETALQEGLEEMYRTMNEETLKSIRRIMPFTRTKMEWNINAVRMVRQTQAAKK